jgi:hypothetical protein
MQSTDLLGSLGKKALKMRSIFYIFVLLAIVVLFFWQPIAIVSQTNESDQNPRHIRKVFSQSKIGQTTTVPTGNISGITLKLNNKNLPKDTPIVFTIKNSPNDNQNLLKINTTIYDAGYDNNLAFRFKPINKKNIYFDLEAPTLNEKDCLPLRYQIDSGKYQGGQTFINGDPVYGDIAFSVLSSPPLIFLITDYAAKHPTVGIAFILICACFFTWRMRPKEKTHHETTESIKIAKEWPQVVIIFLFTLFSFAPLLNMYFRQDDFVILDRARTLLTENPSALFMNRGFVEASRSDMPVQIAFYRPISNSVIPTLLYTLFGTKAWLHYLFNFLIHAINAVGIYFIFRHFINKNLALTAALVWATHSAVFVTVAWLSSIQEVLSTFFFVFSLLAISIFWKKPQKIYWLASLILYIFAILSKENAFVFLAIAPLFLFAINRKEEPLKNKIREIAFYSTPYLFFSAIVLLIRNWMLNEQGLRIAFIDHSYRASTNPPVIFGNIMAYLSWAAQSWIPGFVAGNTEIEKYLTKIEETTGWINIPPLYILLTLFFLISVIVLGFVQNKKNKGWWFSISFYFIASLPFLLLLNERQERWLYLPLVGLILALGVAIGNFATITNILNKKISLIVILVFIAFETQWMLNNNPHMLEAKAQSSFTKQAIYFLKNNHSSIPDSTEIVIVNMPPARKQNLGYAAIPLMYKNPSLKTSYPDDAPKEKENNKIYLIYSEEKNALSEMRF